MAVLLAVMLAVWPYCLPCCCNTSQYTGLLIPFLAMLLAPWSFDLVLDLMLAVIPTIMLAVILTIILAVWP